MCFRVSSAKFPVLSARKKNELKKKKSTLKERKNTSEMTTQKENVSLGNVYTW